MKKLFNNCCSQSVNHFLLKNCVQRLAGGRVLPIEEIERWRRRPKLVTAAWGRDFYVIKEVFGCCSLK